MRSIVLLALLSVACEEAEVDLTPPAAVQAEQIEYAPLGDVEVFTLSTFRSITNGFVLFDDALALGGMYGGDVTCYFDAPSGGAGDDNSGDDDDCDDSYDHDDPYGGDSDDDGDDKIESYALMTGGDHLFMVETPTGIHDRAQVWRRGLRIALPGALEGRLWDGGAVALTFDQGCGVEWVDVDHGAGAAAGQVTDRHYQPLDDAWCAGGVDVGVDREGGALILGGPEGVIAVRQGEVETLATSAREVAWDNARDQLYVAPAGDTRLQTFSAYGVSRWSVDLGLPINAVAPLADTGAVLVHAGEAGLPGRVVVLDASTGEEAASLEGYYRDVAQISASPTGLTASLWSPTEQTAWTLRIVID